MGRTINHVERISESFDALDSMTQSDIVFELFTRLTDAAKQSAFRRMDFHAMMSGTRPSTLDKPRRKSTPVPPLMERAEVEAAGKLALEEPKGKLQ